MTESQGKVVFDIDGQKAYKAAQNITKEFQTVGAQLARSITGAMSLAQMLDRAADAAKRIREETAESQKERGGASLQRGSAGRIMGLNAMQLQAYKNIQETGAVDEQQQVAFMQSLAKAGGKRVRGHRGLQYVQAFATGAFTQEELLDAAKRGRGVDIDARLGGLSLDERQELALRSHELNNRRRLDGGVAQRLALSEIERQRRDNPVLSAINEGAYGVPVIGGLAREAAMERLGRSYGEGKDDYNGRPLLFDYSRPMPTIDVNRKPSVGSRGENAP
jgi:hypothetical protein